MRIKMVEYGTKGKKRFRKERGGALRGYGGRGLRDQPKKTGIGSGRGHIL